MSSSSAEGRGSCWPTRELGARGSAFALALASRLGLEICDRELLEQEALRLGVSASEVEKVDEHPAGILQRFLPGSLHHRYFEALRQIMSELAQRGNVLIVGRGGNRLLRECFGAFHVRLVASLPARVRRVMEHRWVRESVARQVITDSDTQRRRFSESCFGADWADPLEYHLTVNAAQLGPAAVDAVALAASRHSTEVVK